MHAAELRSETSAVRRSLLDRCTGWVHASDRRVAGFILITSAVLLLLSHALDELRRWVWQANRVGEGAWPAVEELFTAEGLGAGVVRGLAWADRGLGPLSQHVDHLLALVLCLVAARVLFRTSLSGVWTELGFPRARRSELVVALVACGIAFALGLATLEFTARPLDWGVREEGALGTGLHVVAWLLQLAFAPLEILIGLGFLYRGLRKVARWSVPSCVLAYAALESVPFLIGGWDSAIVALAGFLTLMSLVNVWIAERWSLRLWVLAFLVVGSSLALSFLRPELSGPDANPTAWSAVVLTPIAVTAILSLCLPLRYRSA